MKIVYLLTVWVAVGLAEEIIPSVQELRTGNIQFSANTYKELTKLGDNNFLVCPLSVSVVLALVEAGAGGSTAQQLLSGLSLPDSSEKTQEAYKAISPSLNVEKEYTLSSANKMFVKKNFDINPQYSKIATQVFNSEIQNVDFTDDKVVGEINDWVKQKTKDKITDLVTRKDIEKDTRLVLVNALYFNGDWVHPFKPEKTNIQYFTTIEKQQIKVNMMAQNNDFNYYEDKTLKAKFLEMSYKGGDISMTFVLPNDVNGLASLEANIGNVLKTPAYNKERVHVEIPTITEEHVIKFIPILQHLGIEDLFGTTANLTGIGAHSESLYVSKVIQKTFIDITEKGTTAAAATAVIILPGSPAPPPPPAKEFIADHPFIYYLKYPHGILFVGRYVGKK